MRSRHYYIVNAITFYRIIAAFFLFFLIIVHRSDIFKWLLAISFSTDAIDGYLARRYKVISLLGSRLDSIGDDLTIAAGIFGMIILRPGFLRQEIILMILLLILFVAQTTLALIRYRRMSSFHTYAAKIAAIFQGVFLLSLFFLDKPLYPLFYLTVALTAIDLVEEIALVFVLREWTTDVKGLYWVLRENKLAA